MQTIEITIKAGQTLSDIPELSPLPSNAIIHKRLPGLGATHSEINSSRHSIIVLPNVPVIKSKVNKHNNQNPDKRKILGVHKGVSTQAILEYLENPDVEYKKILITPESYHLKLKEATSNCFHKIQEGYYLLIDECERAIQDVDYREHITAPFDDLFGFTSKGLISATTLPFSDPRLAEFTNYIITPEYAYQKDLKLVITNNIVSALHKHLHETPASHYFIFTSSITLMKAIITALDLKKECQIHCSEEKVRKLRVEGYHASSSFDAEDLQKYNFFTSRFYSAVDIELDFKVDVIMLTDVLFAENSIIDPQTEGIQIPGRFRNGTNSITHITNVNPAIETKTTREVLIYIKELREVYTEMLAIKRKITSLSGKSAIDEVLNVASFARFFYKGGEYNWFMIDNFIQEQRVLTMYQNTNSVLAAYTCVKKHYNLLYNEPLLLPLSDRDRLRRVDYESNISLTKTIINQFKVLYPPPGQPLSYNFTTGNELEDLRAANPLIVEAMETIGEVGIMQADYNSRKIRSAITKWRLENQLFEPKVLEDVNGAFEPYNAYPNAVVKSTLQDIFNSHGITKVATVNDINLYFNATPTTRGATRVPHQNLAEAKFDPNS